MKITHHELELGIAALIVKYDQQWTRSDFTDYEALGACDEARNALRSIQVIAEVELAIQRRVKELVLRVYYEKQWTCNCTEPWQRNPDRFYLMDEQSRYVAEGETVAELIAKAGDVLASWESNKATKLSELAEIFETPLQ